MFSQVYPVKHLRATTRSSKHRGEMPLHVPTTLIPSTDCHGNVAPSTTHLSTQSQSSKTTLHSNNKIQQMTNTVQHIPSESPHSNRPTSEPKGDIPIRQISPPSQIIPSHQIPVDSTVAPSTNSDLLISGQHLAGDNGVHIGVPPVQKIPSLRNNSFPKISTNFDAPSSSTQRLNPTLQRTSSAPPVRQNVTMNPPISRHKAVPAEPSIDSAPPPHAVKPTFASTLKSVQEQSYTKIDISPAQQTTKQGYPAIIFRREDYMVKLAKRGKFTLIGKFDSTMPRMEVIRRSFEAQVQLKSTVKITHFNSNYVYIDLDNQLDHDTVWFRKTIWIQGRPMNLFTWTPTFKPTQETPIAPIWVVLPEFPWHLYYIEAISEILKSIGRAISLDVATFQKTRGSVAKVKLEIDVTKPRPKYLWLGYDDDENGDGYWQEAQYEDVPSYCCYCKHQGHFVDVCSKKRRDDEMRKISIPVEATRHSPQNDIGEITKQPPGINTAQHTKVWDVNQRMSNSGKPPAQKQHFVPKKPVNPVSYRPNPTVDATVNSKLHPVTEENSGGCLENKINQISDALKNNEDSSAGPEGDVTDVVTHIKDAGVNKNSTRLSEVQENSSRNLNSSQVTNSNAFALLSTDLEFEVPVNAVSISVAGNDVPGNIISAPPCVSTDAAADRTTTVAELSTRVMNAVRGESGVLFELQVPDQPAQDTVHAPIDSTKAWVEKSFPKSPACGIAPVDQSKHHQPTSVPVAPDSKNTSTTGGKNKKKSGKKPRKSVQQTEEEILKAEKMAFWDAILAKSHAQIPVIESNNKALTVYVPPPHSSNTLTSKLMKEDNGSVQKDDTVEEMENAVTVYDAVPLLVMQPPPVTGATGQVVDALPHAAETTKNWVNSAFGKIGFATKWDEEHPKSECTHNRTPLSIHDKLKQYAGYEHEPDVFFLGDIFNESLEGNALTPTHQLESMCNEASKVIKLAGQSNWNLNAQPFTPNDIPPKGIVVATEKAQPNDVATESAPVQPKRVQPSRSSRSKPYRGKG